VQDHGRLALCKSSVNSQQLITTAAIERDDSVFMVELPANTFRPEIDRWVRTLNTMRTFGTGILSTR
jgi:hypothetical protein